MAQSVAIVTGASRFAPDFAALALAERSEAKLQQTAAAVG
jgi:hypothetical protein